MVDLAGRDWDPTSSAKQKDHDSELGSYLSHQCDRIQVIRVACHARNHQEDGLVRKLSWVQPLALPVKAQRSTIWQRQELSFKRLRMELLIKEIVEAVDKCLHEWCNSKCERFKLNRGDACFPDEFTHQRILLRVGKPKLLSLESCEKFGDCEDYKQ